MYRALERGLSFKTTFGNVLTLTPPLTTTRGRDGRRRSIFSIRASPKSSEQCAIGAVTDRI